MKEIKVSETMRPDILMDDTAVGLWDPTTQRIIIKRSQLGTLRLFAGTLLHEMTHAATGLPDVSRPFESALTDLLGETAAAHCAVSDQIAKAPTEARSDVPIQSKPQKGTQNPRSWLPSILRKQ